MALSLVLSMRRAATASQLSEVVDPLMWVRGQLRILCYALKLMARRVEQAVDSAAHAVQEAVDAVQDAAHEVARRHGASGCADDKGARAATL